MKNLFKHLGADLPAGLVVFLVAIPLCLGIALGSEVPPISGLIAGISGGIVVGSISNSRIGVSGPAAGLITIVVGAMATFRAELGADGVAEENIDMMALQMLGLAVLISGVLQFILGLIKAGFIAYYFPDVVIKGMLAAIGIILIKKQLSVGLGYNIDSLKEIAGVEPKGDLSFWKEITTVISNPSEMTLMIIGITVVSLLILILWETKWIKKSFLGYIPGAVLVVGLGIVFSLITDGTPNALADSARVDLGVSGKGFKDLFAFPLFDKIGSSSVWIAAITLAVIASVETLLCAEATDKLDPEKAVTNPNRELLAQGAGNMLSGALGGLPVVQVIVRSSANISAGAKTKLSAIVHGVLLVASIALLSSVLNLIPYASLAAILFMVGYKLAKPVFFKIVYKKGWFEFIPFMATIIGILVTDLLIGIGIGLAFSIAFILWVNYKTSHYLEKKEIDGQETYIVHLFGHMNFLNKAGLNADFNSIPADSKVILEYDRVIYLSVDIKETIEHFKERAAVENIEITVTEQGEISQAASQ